MNAARGVARQGLIYHQEPGTPVTFPGAGIRGGRLAPRRRVVLVGKQIKRLCRTDVAMRVISGLQVPDHAVIAQFRQRHQDSVRELFTQVLLVCAKAGLGRG